MTAKSARLPFMIFPAPLDAIERAFELRENFREAHSINLVSGVKKLKYM